MFSMRFGQVHIDQFQPGFAYTATGDDGRIVYVVKARTQQVGRPYITADQFHRIVDDEYVATQEVAKPQGFQADGVNPRFKPVQIKKREQHRLWILPT